MGELDLAIDLADIAEQDRQPFWKQWVSGNFPGMEVVRVANDKPVGQVRSMNLGAAVLWDFVGGAQSVRYLPPGDDDNFHTVAVVLQRAGTAIITQSGNVARLRANDLCLLDNARPFDIEALDISAPLILVLPRYLAQARFPALIAQTARAFDDIETLPRLLGNLIIGTISQGPNLDAGDTGAILEAALALMTGMCHRRGSGDHQALWRVQRACRDVAELGDRAGLEAGTIAARQNISRRSLDKLFLQHIGRTVSAQIMEWRLGRAAAILGDPGSGHRPISDICFALGFKDTGHFARAFRKRFDCTPSDWRKQSYVTYPAWAQSGDSSI